MKMSSARRMIGLSTLAHSALAFQGAPPLVGTSPAVLATPHPLRGGAPVVSSRAARGAGGFLTALRGMAGQPAMKGKHPIRTEARVATVTIDSAAAEDWAGDLLVVPIFEPEGDDKKALAKVEGVAATLDSKTGGAVKEMIETFEFKGKPKSSQVVRVQGVAFKNLAIVGAGKSDKMDATGAAGLGAALASLANVHKAKSAAVVLPEGASAEWVAALSEAVQLGLYQDTRFKSEPEETKTPTLASVAVLAFKGDAADALARAPHLAAGVGLARDLVSAPPNYVTPTMLAEVAQGIAKDHAGFTATVLDRAECEKRGMGAYLGVAQGACEPPKFIHLTYKGKGEAKRKVAVVGKGLTFDSGGYNLKAGPGSMIELMKFDMGGSAATLGAAKAIALLQPEGVEAHFIVAACENMVSAEAMRPGDILTASNGKTIEVINTDAEGRLTLADALVYAEAQGAEEIVDIATLTGACIVSLGNAYAGLWAGDEQLADALKASFKATGEKVWQMPLVADYAEQIKSPIADLRNLGAGPAGGSITAALFLKEFVKDAKWAHLDIAGPVWNAKESAATGYGVKALTHWITSPPLPKDDK